MPGALTRRGFFRMAGARGEPGGVSIWGGARYAVHDGTRATLRDCASLFDKPPQPV